MAGKETVLLENPENERGPVTIELVWDPETSKGSPPAEVISKVKGVTEAKTYNAVFTSGTVEDKDKAYGFLYKPAYKYYKFYIAFQGGKPIGGISVLKDTNYISFLRAHGEDVYNALLEYYKTNINPADTNPTETIVPDSDSFGALRWGTLTEKQKQPPDFHRTRSLPQPIHAVSKLRGLGETLPTESPAERGTGPMKPTPVEDQAPFKVFRKSGGTRRRRNLRKRNRKTRKWTSSGIPTRS